LEKSAFAIAVDDIQSTLRPVLKEAGFRVKGRTFNRRMPDGVIHVLGIQMGAADPPGTTYIPGFRENMHGLFAVNLGIYVPEVSTETNGVDKDWVPEYYCCIRARLGALVRSDKEVWWHAEASTSVIEDLLSAIRGPGMKFFEQFPNRDAVVDLAYRERDRVFFGTPPRITAAVILTRRGDHEKARTLLTQQITETTNPGHPEYVRKLAQNMGLGQL